MKDRIIKDLPRFLEVADEIAIPFKWYEISGECVTAEIEMSNRSLFWEGETGGKAVKRLEDHGFCETETRRE